MVSGISKNASGPEARVQDLYKTSTGKITYNIIKIIFHSSQINFDPLLVRGTNGR